MAETPSPLPRDEIKTQYILGNFFRGAPDYAVLASMREDFLREFGHRYIASDFIEIEKTRIIVDFKSLHGEYFGTGRLQTYLIIVYTY